MDELVITWQVSQVENQKIIYFVNDNSVGNDNFGFDKILNRIKNDVEIKKVIIKIKQISSLGGKSLRGSLPFSDRFEELEKILQERKLIFEIL